MDRRNGKRADAPTKKSFNGLKWNDGRRYPPVLGMTRSKAKERAEARSAS